MDTRAKLVLTSPEVLSARERADLEEAINAGLAEGDPTGGSRCELSVPPRRSFALDPVTGTILAAVVRGGGAAVVTRLIFAVAAYLRLRNKVIEIQAGPAVKLTLHARTLEDPAAKKALLEFLEKMGALTEPGAEAKVSQLIDAKTAAAPSVAVPT
jgi:hypothetical protein